MKESMFYYAHPLVFKRAEELRNNPTDTEVILWDFLQQKQLGIKFRRQHPASYYVLDFYAHEIKLAIEIDGSIHSLDNVKKNDVERQSYLENLGIVFLRFSNVEVKHEPEKVCFIIQQKIEELTTKKRVTSSPLRAGGFKLFLQ